MPLFLYFWSFQYKFNTVDGKEHRLMTRFKPRLSGFGSDRFTTDHCPWLLFGLVSNPTFEWFKWISNEFKLNKKRFFIFCRLLFRMNFEMKGLSRQFHSPGNFDQSRSNKRLKSILKSLLFAICCCCCCCWVLQSLTDGARCYKT